MENQSFTDSAHLKESGKEARGVTIIVNALSKRFNHEWIFRNLNFEFIPGKTYAITGPNGSGKSTLLQVLWGQVPQSSGDIKYLRSNEDLAVEDIYRHISIAAPYMDLIEEFTLAETLEFHFKLKPIRAGHTIADLLKIMYLEQAADKHLSNFSSGMKQRVKLALAFYTTADIVFLDEPGTNLDNKAFGWYLEQLSLLPSKTTLFIASNDAREYAANAHIFDMTTLKSGATDRNLA